jgi:hypothetical protein
MQWDPDGFRRSGTDRPTSRDSAVNTERHALLILGAATKMKILATDLKISDYRNNPPSRAAQSIPRRINVPIGATSNSAAV